MCKFCYLAQQALAKEAFEANREEEEKKKRVHLLELAQKARAPLPKQKWTRRKGMDTSTKPGMCTGCGDPTLRVSRTLCPKCRSARALRGWLKQQQKMRRIKPVGDKVGDSNRITC